jgi:hypothetical protein
MCRRRAIPGITQHTLTTQLRELEADGLRCKIFAEVPPRVEYAITPAARAPKSVIDAVFTCWPNHDHGDANNAVLAAVGYNFRRLIKWLRILLCLILVMFFPQSKPIPA